MRLTRRLTRRLGRRHPLLLSGCLTPHPLLLSGQRYRDEVVVRLAVEEIALHDGARGDHADDVALHEVWVLGIGLLADGHFVAGLEEPAQIAVHGVVGDAGHGDALVLAHVAAGQGDAEHSCGDAGIVIEGLVEVAEAEEQQGVRVLLLDAEVLAAQGGLGHGRAASWTQSRMTDFSVRQSTFRRSRGVGSLSASSK